jgi:hypothetical protein
MELPDAMTHFPDEPCPFATDENPIGMLGSCCSLRGKVAAHELDALGEEGLSACMFENMTAEVAIAFAKELGAACDRLERDFKEAPAKPKGAGWNGTLDPTTKEWHWQTYSTFEESIAAIRIAAKWYEKVGRLGYGVDAWY